MSIICSPSVTSNLRNQLRSSNVATLAKASLSTSTSSSRIGRVTAPRAASQLYSTPRNFAARTFSTSLTRMGGSSGEDNTRPDPDTVLQTIADYVHNYKITSDQAYKVARLTLLDSVACSLEALKFPTCTQLLGPFTPGGEIKNGARVIGRSEQIDVIKATFDNGCLIRFLDWDNTFLAQEWHHPADALGATLSVTDNWTRNGLQKFTIKDVLESSIKSHEISGILGDLNSFNRVGIDHVLLIKIAAAATVSKLIGNTREQTIDVLSHAFCEPTLRAYRHAPNAGPRKSWAAGDAASRAVHLALLVQRGEQGLPSALTAKTWGFYDVFFKGNEFKFNRDLDSYFMENVLFKLVPAEFHAQTAVEAAIILNKEMKESGKTVDDIKKINLATTEAGVRIICKRGKLDNFAARDHELGFMFVVSLMNGDLEAHYYSDDYANATPKIDELRSKIEYEEDKKFTEEYLDDKKRYIGNRATIEFNDGSKISKEIHAPLGHPSRRDESVAAIKAKYERSLEPHFDGEKKAKMMKLFDDDNLLDSMPITEFMDLFAKAKND